MHRDAVGAGLGEVRDVPLGALDHQMDVQVPARAVDLTGERLDDRGAHAERRHEVAVHHVDVDRARARGEHGADLLAQPREVRGQDRRRHACGRGRHQIGWSIELRQWLHAYSAVLDIRTIVECSPQFGQTDASSKRRRQFTQR
jgi:hypothetical protein